VSAVSIWLKKLIGVLFPGSATADGFKLSVTKTIEWTGFKMSDLVLKRRYYTNISTVGELYFGEEFLAYTLEDTLRKGPKLEGITAIPAGKYEVVVNFSDRFKKMMPLLLDVPGFTGVRIHSGNTAADTEGCILVGLDFSQETPNFIGRSRDAFNLVFPRIQEYVSKEKLFISISNIGRDVS